MSSRTRGWRQSYSRSRVRASARPKTPCLGWTIATERFRAEPTIQTCPSDPGCSSQEIAYLPKVASLSDGKGIAQTHHYHSSYFEDSRGHLSKPLEDLRQGLGSGLARSLPPSATHQTVQEAVAKSAPSFSVNDRPVDLCGNVEERRVDLRADSLAPVPCMLTDQANHCHCGPRVVQQIAQAEIPRTRREA
jgi:hypothetical protein